VKEDSWTLRSSTSAATARNTEERHFLEARSKAISQYESLHFNIRRFQVAATRSPSRHLAIPDAMNPATGVEDGLAVLTLRSTSSWTWHSGALASARRPLCIAIMLAVSTQSLAAWPLDDSWRTRSAVMTVGLRESIPTHPQRSPTSPPSASSLPESFKRPSAQSSLNHSIQV
jgi:hypothetical protein